MVNFPKAPDRDFSIHHEFERKMVLIRAVLETLEIKPSSADLLKAS